MKRKGLALIAAIMLIIFVSTAVLGVSAFIAGWLRQVSAEGIEARCIYNALAGVNYAIYRYRDTGFLTNGTTFGIDGNNSFSFSSQPGTAVNLRINATASSLGGSGNREIRGVTLTNTSASPIVLSQMVIYINSGTRTLDQVNIANAPVWTTDKEIGTTQPDPPLDMVDFTIAPNTTRVINFIRWTNNFSGRIAYLRFIMNDFSTSSICTVYPAQPAPCDTTVATAGLTIKSTGRVTGSSQLRPVQAAYSIALGSVRNYDEKCAAVP